MPLNECFRRKKIHLSVSTLPSIPLSISHSSFCSVTRRRSPLFSRSCENEKFILKDVPDFQYLHDIYSKVDPCPHLRLPQDTIPDRSMYVYKFFTDDFLSLVATTDLPVSMTKRILKDSLRGIAALHDQNIVHNG